MANMLAWLTGRDDQTGQPSPLQYDDGQPSLRAYNPPPSEQFAGWLSGLLGAGPGASLAKQNFATGIPSLLQMSPLGVGLSAADLQHARAADDPMGAAAAAIGMLPAAGPEARAGAKILGNTAKGSIGDLERMMTDLLGTPYAKAIKSADNMFAGSPPAAKPPSFDYEKDNTGLYHIFDAMTGKTQAVVNTPNEAKGWIAKQTGKPADLNPEEPIPKFKESFMDLPAPDILRNPSARPPWLGSVLPEDQRQAARAAGNYTTPAYRGISVYPGEDIGTTYKGAAMFSSANPQIADMYTSYLSKHPGDTPAQHAYRDGATVMPLWLDTSNYHTYDAAGKSWAIANERAIKEAKSAGKLGVTIHNVYDEPNSTKSLSPQTVHITFPEGQTTVKSQNAAMFDPTAKSIAKVLPFVAGGAVAGEAWSPSDANATTAQRPQMVQPQSITDKINEIMNGLDWQGQWMDRMRLPLDNYANKLRSQR